MSDISNQTSDPAVDGNVDHTNKTCVPSGCRPSGCRIAMGLIMLGLCSVVGWLGVEVQTLKHTHAVPSLSPDALAPIYQKLAALEKTTLVHAKALQDPEQMLETYKTIDALKQVLRAGAFLYPDAAPKPTSTSASLSTLDKVLDKVSTLVRITPQVSDKPYYLNVSDEQVYCQRVMHAFDVAQVALVANQKEAYVLAYQEALSVLTEWVAKGPALHPLIERLKTIDPAVIFSGASS